MNHKTCRAMHGVASQIPTSGSITSSRTYMGTVGVSDATRRLAQDVLDLITTGTPDSAYLQMLDALALDSVTNAAAAAVAALPVFAEAPHDLPELEQRLGVVQAAEAERPGAQTREILNCVTSVINERITEFGSAIRLCFQSQPAGIASAIAQCRERFKDLVAPRQHPEKLRRYVRIVVRLRELPEHEPRLLPDVYADVRRGLLQTARVALDEAVTELAARKSAAALESRRLQLESVLTAMDSAGTRFNRQTAAVIAQLQDECRQARCRQAELTSSLTIPLPGPEEEQVLVGCRTKTRCPDHAALVARVLQEFDNKIREHVTSTHTYLDGANTSLPTLLTDLPAQEIIPLFKQTVKACQSDEHTLYRLIGAAGAEVCARRLWERAAPTCFTAALDDFRFGIAPVEYTIVQLPLAANPSDEQTRSDLADAFHRVAPRCHITDGRIGQEVLVTRVLNGHVIGVEDNTACLLQRHVEAHEIGHAPYLLLFFPDSTYGEVTDATLHLAEYLHTSHEGEQNGHNAPDR